MGGDDEAAGASGPDKDKKNHFYVGGRISLKGTGKWWVGGRFRATIVDIRKEDDTVKVQYDDGGFKRFKRDQFVELFGDVDDTSLDFGTRDYEWSDDQFNPLTQVETELTDVRTALRKAIQSRDFLKAAELKELLDTKTEAASHVRHLEYHLREAVESQDYLRANDLQRQIDERRAALAITTPAEQVKFLDILAHSGKRALGSGMAGAIAMVVQVTSLMWMRTTMNYQYKNGSSMMTALRTLYKEGGVMRFYRGYLPALAQGPLSRFGDTAANVGVLTFLNAHDSTRDLPIGIKTFFSSAAAAGWRVVLMPIDTIKTSMQVNGADGMKLLMEKRRLSGFSTFFHGSIGASAATFAGHYPWFATYNALDASIPVPDDLFKKLGRNATIGFCASAVSDTVSNSLRVLKTVRQTSEVTVSYAEAAKTIIKTDGIVGLFGRGLRTRLLANGIQGMMFSVAWKFLDDKFRS